MSEPANGFRGCHQRSSELHDVSNGDEAMNVAATVIGSAPADRASNSAAGRYRQMLRFRSGVQGVTASA
jgi:hypothetical protein